ncbi:MAG: hypothetical protein ABJP45_01845 [Cyclobacteriaceae bacterium]
MKTSILISLLLFIIQENPQVENANSKELFFKKQASYLLQEGGIWEAVNPTYQKDKQYDARVFRYEVEKGVHGENIQLKIVSDLNDIGWYTSWDGYYLWQPQREEIIYHSLAANGAIANGIVTTPDSTTRINIFTITAYDGTESTHKDVTRKVNENEMKSESYQQGENGEWSFNQELIWKRVSSDKP